MIIVNVREWMARKNIDNIKPLMEESKLSRNAINKLYRENDVESIKLETLIRLCDYFQCNLSQLIEYMPDNQNYRD